MSLVGSGIVNDEYYLDMRVTDIPEIANLTTAEKILLVEDLWDVIRCDEMAVSIPRDHLDELERRQAAYEAAPQNLLTLEELSERLEHHE